MSIYTITDFDALTQDLKVNKNDKLEYYELYPDRDQEKD